MVRTPSAPNLRSKLAAALKSLPIKTAYLFGSQATDTAGPRSDVDIAILPNPDLGQDKRFRLRLEAIGAISGFGNSDHADAVLLDDPTVPAPLRFNAIQPGVILIDRDPAYRHAFEVKTLQTYYDGYFRLKLSSRLRFESLAKRGRHDR